MSFPSVFSLGDVNFTLLMAPSSVCVYMHEQQHGGSVHVVVSVFVSV